MQKLAYAVPDRNGASEISSNPFCADAAVLRLAYALKAFLETAECDLCPQWPVHSGVPEYVRRASVEYRAEEARRRRWR